MKLEVNPNAKNLAEFLGISEEKYKEVTKAVVSKIEKTDRRYEVLAWILENFEGKELVLALNFEGYVAGYFRASNELLGNLL